MADVTRIPGLAEQIRLVAALRWRILRNGLQRRNNRWDLFGLVFAGIFAAVLVFGLCFAFSAGAYALLSGDLSRAHWLGLLFGSIFLFWQLFPVFVAGFGAHFEFRTLLRFPLSLPAFYTIGLAYGLADFAAIASVCWLIAMTIGATAARPEVLPVMLLVGALFLLLNITLERLLGSWLERILARRRSREIFVALFVLLMISTNFLTPLMNRYGNVAGPRVLRLLPYFAAFPPSLAGRAIAAAARHEVGGLLLGTAGLALYVVLLSVLLWQRFAAQYRGEELSETPAPARARARPVVKTAEQEDVLRLLSPHVAAVLRKEFRYLTRNGFAFLTLLMPPVLVLLFSMQFTGRHPTATARGVSAELFFPGMMAYMILILMAPAYNSFAYEGKGMQAYFMAPLRFREVFLGKNLMLVAVIGVEMLLSIFVLAFRVGLPSPPMFMATMAAIVFAVAGQLSIANWSSLCFPRKMEFGQLRGQRNSGMAVWISFGVQLVLGGVCTLVMFIGRWTGNAWLPTEAFVGLGAAAMGGYFASLDALTKLAEKNKETLIDALCR
jgi:ABC-2 type transport system permease protein